MDKSSKDIKILKYAREHNMVIITQDLDFSMLLAVGGYSKPSLINIRIENPEPESVTDCIVKTVSRVEQDLKKGIVVTIDETSVRYRNLPIEIK
jgi:predicted nuclease of predicted toxin-antitoxin system